MQSCHQKGVLAEESGSLLPSRAGLSRCAVTNVNRKQERATMSSSLLLQQFQHLPGQCTSWAGDWHAQRNAPGPALGRLQPSTTLCNPDPAQPSQTPSVHCCVQQVSTPIPAADIIE